MAGCCPCRNSVLPVCLSWTLFLSIDAWWAFISHMQMMQWAFICLLSPAPCSRHSFPHFFSAKLAVLPQMKGWRWLKESSRKQKHVQLLNLAEASILVQCCLLWVFALGSRKMFSLEELYQWSVWWSWETSSCIFQLGALGCVCERLSPLLIAALWQVANCMKVHSGKLRFSQCFCTCFRLHP